MRERLSTISPFRNVFITYILFIAATAFGPAEPPNSSVTIVQLSEQEYYEQREEQLFPLNPDLLNKGNWSHEDLTKFARNLPYETDVNQLFDLKNDIEALGILNVQITKTNEEITSTFTIIHSFEAEIYRGCWA